MMRSAFVTGATGLLGRQVVEAFKNGGWNVVGSGFSRASPPSTLKVDLCQKSEIERALDDVNSALLVAAHKLPLFAQKFFTKDGQGAAQRFPDKVDKDPAAARALNITASQDLAHATNARSILLIYISTDYVFPGTPGQAPYEANATPHPTNMYGQTKLDGEQVTLEATKKSALGLVLRVPVLYGPTESNSESAVNTLMDSVYKAQDPAAGIKMDDWSIRTPTCTQDVGRVCRDIAVAFPETGEERMQWPKVLQFTAHERFTKYQICQMFSEIMGLSLDGMEANKQGNDPNASVQRPYDCHLSTKALEGLGIDISAVNFQTWW
ncbi:MAG: hypothetical protein M1828_005720 [Chrysothrix sp. TS-e1954]|nr:MAG: hypothetical protein M1828_005720 [Chrysothrix sp. TS-e1954]